MPTANINGIDLYFEQHGSDGEPLVLVHGYTGDITDWRHQLPEFSRTHRVLIMDHRGHGRSSVPSDRDAYSILQLADDVGALIATAGFDRYHLLGHSMGGAVAQEIALRGPGRLLSLTLHDTSPGFSTRNEVVKKFIQARHQYAEEHGMAAVAAMPSVVKPPPFMPEDRGAEMSARLGRMSVDAFIGTWDGLQAWPGTRDRAAKISTPTLVISGELDAPQLVEASRWLASEIPNATLEVIPEAGHAPQYERPALFNAALRRHLESNAAGSPT